MPTILHEQGFFSFYASDQGEPPHVHVSKGDGRAKWWVAPVRQAWSHRFKKSEVATIGRIVRDNQGFFLDEWRRFFPPA